MTLARKAPRFSLNDKVAVVTGGGSGIGKAIASEFCEAGATVYILEVDKRAGQSSIEEIRKKGGLVHLIRADVSDQLATSKAFSGVLDREGRVDILINNAGIAHVGTAETTTEEDFDRILQVNVKGMYNCIHGVLPMMRQAKRGVILNMASVAATVGVSERFAYSTSKGAVLTMTYQVAKDFVQDGIRCNSISPGRVHTPFVDGYLADNYPGREQEVYDQLAATQPIGRMARPEEIAWLARFLCSDEASFITGTDFPIDGGFIRLNT